MKKLMFAAVAMVLAGALWADSYAFTYQAALRDEKGNVLETRNHAVTIRLWDAPADGTLLWSRSFNVMTDANGLFNLAVSDDGSKVSGEIDSTLESVFVSKDAGDVYIGLEVANSAGEIVPRQRLFAVPFAAVANDVRKITKDVIVSGNIQMGGANPTVQVTKDGIIQKSGSSTFQNLSVNGTLSAGGLVTATKGLTVNGGTLAVKTNLEIDSGKKLTIGGAEVIPVPVGGIIMWTGTNLPDEEHWAICNGQKKNGKQTPDLRNRFIVGAGSSYNVGDVGGANSVELLEEQMPKHDHKYVGDDQLDELVKKENGTVGDYIYNYDASSQRSGNARRYWTSYRGGNSSLGDGHSVPHENRPPYYALYYIMRVK